MHWDVWALNNIKMIIFDFDGTIADTLPITIKCINQLSSQYGYQTFEQEEDLQKYRDKGVREIIFNCLGLKYYQVPMYTVKGKKLIKQYLKEMRVFEGIQEALKILSKKYKIAILTSNSGEVVDAVLKKSMINEVDYIHSDSSIFGKHLSIKKFLLKHNLNKDDIIYVGDEMRDIEACKKVGVKMISVSWGYNSKRALEKLTPDYLVESVDELLSVLD